MKGWERAIGVIGGTITILSFVLEMFGVSAFGLLSSGMTWWLPLLAAFGGGCVGWFLRALYETGLASARDTSESIQAEITRMEKTAAHEAQEAELDKRMREIIEALDGEQIGLLATAFKYGAVERDYDTRDAVLLKGMTKLGLMLADGVGAVTGTWKLAPRCRRVMEGMELREGS